MMWNFALSSLLLGSTLCIYNGSPNYPDNGTLWRFAERACINHFGHGAVYYEGVVEKPPKELINPDFNNFNYMKLAPVACALCYAISMTITKITSEKDNVYTQMIHLYFGATIISILFFIFTGQGQLNNFTDPTFQFIFREWFTNPSYAWPFIVAMGCIGAVAFFFVFSAYTVASPSVISLYEYSLIIWSPSLFLCPTPRFPTDACPIKLSN